MTAPASMSMLQWRNDIPRGGVARESAVVAIATTLFFLNRVEGKPGVTLATSPTAGAFTYSIAGTKYAGASATWNLAGLPDVPPFRRMTYLLLVDRTGAPAVYASVPTPLNEPQRWAPNGPEALIVAMNQGTGYAIVGYLTVTTDATPWTPGSAFPAAPGTAAVFDGFPGETLLPFSIPPGVNPGLMPR